MDVRSPEFARLIIAERPEVINHHAAQTMVRVSTEQPAYDAEVNILGMINLLQAASQASVRKVIFSSSGGTIYGTCQRLPIAEDEPFAPESPYGISKAASEFYLRYFAAIQGVHYVALRYANIFGPRDTISSEHVITVFIDRLLAGQTPIIHWDGEQAKDYLYVDDAVQANVLALNSGDDQAYNIGSGMPVSVNTIYNLLVEATGIRIPAESAPSVSATCACSTLTAAKPVGNWDGDHRSCLRMGCDVRSSGTGCLHHEMQVSVSGAMRLVPGATLKDGSAAGNSTAVFLPGTWPLDLRLLR